MRLGRFRQLQLGTDSRTAELSNQAKLHAFEAERTQMLKEETDKALAQCQLECEKQQKKLEVQTQGWFDTTDVDEGKDRLYDPCS